MAKSPFGKIGLKWIVLALVAAVAAGGGAMLVNDLAGPGRDDKNAEGLSTHAAGGLSSLTVLEAPVPAPDHVFFGPDGAEARLADFTGRVVVLNLWASWCAPCKIEMPTLAALAADPPGEGLLVLPVSVDTGETATAAAREFLAEQAPLAFYHDPSFRMPFLFEGKGAMPQTVLIDRQGRVRAALTGEADWNGAEARALIAELLAEEA